MNEILNEIIEIDKNAQEIARAEKEKKLDIESYIETEFKNKKTVLDEEYSQRINEEKEKYKKRFIEKQEEIRNISNVEISKMQNVFDSKKSEYISSIVTGIVEE